MATGINVFLVPQRLSTGGITAVGTVLKYTFNIPLWLTNITLNIILFLFGFRLLKKSAVFSTVFGILMLTFFLEITAHIPCYKGDTFIAFISGGILAGVGLGIVIRQGASTGGSDFAALMLNKVFPHVSIGRLMLIIDCAIIIISGLIFKSVTVTVYSLCALYLTVRLSDLITMLGDSARTVYIFSHRADVIAASIINQLERGVTAISAKGMYLKKESNILLCAVAPKELPQVVEIVRKADKAAFIIINEAHQVLGKGFKAL